MVTWLAPKKRPKNIKEGKKEMKKFLKAFVAATALSVLLGMSSQAAVKKVSIATPSQVRITKTVGKTSRIYIGKGLSNKLTLKASVKVTGKSSDKVKFTSSNKKVATVSSKGVVTFKKAGKVTITATSKANSKKKASWKFNVKSITTKVKKVSVTNVSKSKLTMAVGQKYTLETSVAPKTASCKNLKYTSSNKSVVSVSQSGVLTAKKKGTATIKVAAVDGSKKYKSIKVTVKNPVTYDVEESKVVEEDMKLNVNGSMKWSKATTARKQMNKLVAAIVKNNAIPESRKTIEFSTCTVKLTEKGLFVYDLKGNDITSKVYSGSKKFTTLTINEKTDVATMNLVIKGLAVGVQKLDKTYKFSGTLTLKQNKTSLVLSNIRVENGAVRFTISGREASITFNTDGTISFANCAEVAKYFKTITGGIIG